MKYYKKIEGSRLYLSPVNIEDRDIYTKWMNDKEVTENIGRYYKMINNYFEYEIFKNYSKEYHFVIVLKENDTLIGSVFFMDLNSINQSAKLGIFIGDEKNRNKGYGKESINLILDYGFNTLNLNNIMLTVYSFNEIAINTYKKLGFKTIGNRRKCIYKEGKFYDEIYMDILKDEYNDIKDFIFTS